MDKQGKFKIQPGIGANGEPLLVYNDALYAAFKAALLGQSETLITDGPDDIAFRRKQQSRLLRHPAPKAGPWIASVISERPGIPEKIGKWEITLKFVPPIHRPDFDKLFRRWQEEYGLHDIVTPSVHRYSINGELKREVTGEQTYLIEYSPADSSQAASFGTVKIGMRSEAFEQCLKNQIKVLSPLDKR